MNIKFPGEKIIYPNDCLHLLYREIIFILGMKPLQVTDFFGRRISSQFNSPARVVFMIK